MGKTIKIILIVVVCLTVLAILAVGGSLAYIWYRVIPPEIKAIYKATRLAESGAFEKVVECYDEILEKDPSSVFAWDGKGEALHHLGRYEEAISAYDKGLDCVSKEAEKGNT